MPNIHLISFERYDQKKQFNSNSNQSPRRQGKEGGTPKGPAIRMPGGQGFLEKKNFVFTFGEKKILFSFLVKKKNLFSILVKKKWVSMIFPYAVM